MPPLHLVALSLDWFSSSLKVVAANIDVMLEHDAQGKKTKNSPLNGVNQSTSTGGEMGALDMLSPHPNPPNL